MKTRRKVTPDRLELATLAIELGVFAVLGLIMLVWANITGR